MSQRMKVVGENTKRTDKMDFRMRLLDYSVYLVGIVHILISPYTKVEESFNLQATHDLLYYGTDLDHYDHHQFPGVVPRTFLGPLVVSAVASPVVRVLTYLGLPRFYSQYIVRGCLCILVISGFVSFNRAVRFRLGNSIGVWLTLLTLSQFHFLFYASRTLPNIFALVLVLHAYAAYTRCQLNRFTVYSAAAILIFRAELAVLLGLMLVMELFWESSERKDIVHRIKEVISYGLFSLLVFIPLTVLVDSYFWRRTLWPELEVLYFNVVLNKSSDWGVMPFAWYFYSALPRSLLTSIFVLPFAPFLDRRCYKYILPAFVFIFLYSFLPHKELRFIIYSIPLLNTGCALVLSYLWNRRGKSLVWKLVGLAVVGGLCLNLCLTAGLTYISSLNYPGGEAVHKLHQIEGSYINASVHMDVPTCQTGVSRYTEEHTGWNYHKTENLSAQDLLENGYSHLLMLGETYSSEDMSILQDEFEVLDVAKGFDSFKEIWPFRFPRFSAAKSSIFVLRRKMIEGNSS